MAGIGRYESGAEGKGEGMNKGNEEGRGRCDGGVGLTSRAEVKAVLKAKVGAKEGKEEYGCGGKGGCGGKR